MKTLTFSKTFFSSEHSSVTQFQLQAHLIALSLVPPLYHLLFSLKQFILLGKRFNVNELNV